MLHPYLYLGLITTSLSELKLRVTELDCLSHKILKLKLWVFLIHFIVAMVTCCLKDDCNLLTDDRAMTSLVKQ